MISHERSAYRDLELAPRVLAHGQPLLVQAGTADLLFSDSERLAKAAAEAGVNGTLEIGEGLPHVYQILLGTPEATERIEKFLRARVR